MVKKNLKHALKSHETRKAQAVKAQAIEDAAKRKASSIRVGKQSKKRKRQIEEQKQRKVYVQPFERDDTVLLVGEGNFSFAHSLLLAPHSHDPRLLLATALDSEEECYAKYPDAKNHVKAIREIAGRDSIVAFGVDAGALEKSENVSKMSPSKHPTQSLSRWSKVVFNFPHVGAGHKDETRNILANQIMLLRFLVSVAPLLSQGPAPSQIASLERPKEARSSPDSDANSEVEKDKVAMESDGEQEGTMQVPSRAGSILITIRNSKPYTLWDIPMLAKRLPSIHQIIAKSAPPLSKGMKPPSAAHIDRLLALGHGKSYRIWRSFQFHPQLYPLYSHRRTIGWKEGRSKGENEDIVRSDEGESRTWELGLIDIDMGKKKDL